MRLESHPRQWVDASDPLASTIEVSTHCRGWDLRLFVQSLFLWVCTTKEVAREGHLGVSSKLYLALCPRREDPLERDIKLEGQIRHHVVVRLVTTGWRKRLGRHGI
jgi:hypothetical protein